MDEITRLLKTLKSGESLKINPDGSIDIITEFGNRVLNKANNKNPRIRKEIGHYARNIGEIPVERFSTSFFNVFTGVSGFADDFGSKYKKKIKESDMRTKLKLNILMDELISEIPDEGK